MRPEKNPISISIIDPLLLHSSSEYARNGLRYSHLIYQILEIPSPANPLGSHLFWTRPAISAAAHYLRMGLWSCRRMESGSRKRGVESTMDCEHASPLYLAFLKFWFSSGSRRFLSRERCRITQAYWGVSPRTRTAGWFGDFFRGKIANYSLATENFHPSWTYLSGPCVSAVRNFRILQKWRRIVWDIKFLRLTCTPRKRSGKSSYGYCREFSDFRTAVCEDPCSECN